MLDTYKHKGQRNRLVDSLAEKGISDLAVLEAMRRVPRHWFVESALADSAYEDRPLPISEKQTISQPFTVAYQTQLLAITKGMKVLEIGTGSGYQCAVLCEMGARVFTVEIHAALYKQAQIALAELDYDPSMLCGDGSAGWAKHQPYDRILVTAACPRIPEQLQKQLAIGGKMVLPLGNLETQEMCVVDKLSANEFQIQRFDRFKFVPLTGKYGF